MVKCCAAALCVFLGAAWIGAPSAALAGDEAGTTFRDLVRKYAKDGDGKTLAKKIGFSKNVEHVVALEYAVLLLAPDGKKAPVPDIKTHQFRIGDRIHVKIQPVGNSYIYILHEGASGQRLCLLPTSEEKPPFVKAGESVVLPEDGFFEFTEPPGNEQLLVVATEKPVSDLAALANVVFHKPDDQLTAQEKEIKNSIRAKVQERLQSIREQQAGATTYRGLLNDDALEEIHREVKQRGASETVIEEPVAAGRGSAFAMVASTKADAQPTLFVTIPLRSVAVKSGRP